MTKSPLVNYVLGLVLGLAFGLAVGSTVTHHVAMQSIRRVVAQDQAINEIAGKITEQAQVWKQRAEKCEADAAWVTQAARASHTIDAGGQWDAIVAANAIAAIAQKTPPAPEPDPLELLNLARPGLGTAAVAIKRAAQAAQQSKP
jgi:hypothetical protein